MNPSFDQLNQYTHYLESQVEKFTSFMLTQKKLNQKHLQFENSINQFVAKIDKIDQKITLLELKQNDNLYEIKKIQTQKQAVKTFQIRLENIERQLSSILNIESNNSLDQGSEQNQIQKKYSLQKHYKKEQPPLSIHEKDILYLEKYFSQIFAKSQDLETVIKKTKDDLQFRIKKLQIQIEKSKQSFLKLTSNVNTLSSNLTQQSLNKKQSKNQNRIYTQSTKDLNIESMNQQNMATKKQLRKMQKKLENFFSQKLSQMSLKTQKKQIEVEGLSLQKALKFRKIQQKYDKMNLQNSTPQQTKSERKINLSDRQNSSQKKIPLFDNQILKERHLNLMDENQSKKRKTKSRSNKESPIALIDLERFEKQKKGLSSRSRTKKIGKRRSPERIKKIHMDYMMQ